MFTKNLTTEKIMEAFKDLCNEQHSVFGIVPVHEVRHEINRRYGSEAASHETLDAMLKGMRWNSEIRMIALGDPEGVTDEQYEASVPGEGETFFYLEAIK